MNMVALCVGDRLQKKKKKKEIRNSYLNIELNLPLWNINLWFWKHLRRFGLLGFFLNVGCLWLSNGLRLCRWLRCSFRCSSFRCSNFWFRCGYSRLRCGSFWCGCLRYINLWCGSFRLRCGNSRLRCGSLRCSSLRYGITARYLSCCLYLHKNKLLIIMNWIRTRLNFHLRRSWLLCLRGLRSCFKANNVEDSDINLVSVMSRLNEVN